MHIETYCKSFSRWCSDFRTHIRSYFPSHGYTHREMHWGVGRRKSWSQTMTLNASLNQPYSRDSGGKEGKNQVKKRTEWNNLLNQVGKHEYIPLLWPLVLPQLQQPSPFAVGPGAVRLFYCVVRNRVRDTRKVVRHREIVLFRPFRRRLNN